MANIKIRYFIEKPGAADPRYFWQPAKALREHGWQLQRLPDNRRQAIDKAEALNAELDAWRRGEAGVAGGATPIQHVQPKTLAAVIRLYERSRFFTKRAERTKRSYRQNMKFLEAWGGDQLVAAITPKTVEKLYTSMLVATPSKAAAVVTMLRILLGQAMKEEWVPANAAAKARLEGRPPSGRVWPREAVRLFAEAADKAGWHSVGTAVIINHWLGQRETDILTLPPSAIEGGRFNIRQSKTNARVSIPDSPLVRERLTAEITNQARLQAAREAAIRAKGAVPMPTPPQTTFLLCESTAEPWTEHYFRHVFATIRAVLVAEHKTIAHPNGTPEETAKLQFMHLRHTAVTELAAAGCTALQIRGITGHSLTSVNTILERYTVQTAELADSAAAKRTAYEAERKGAKS